MSYLITIFVPIGVVIICAVFLVLEKLRTQRFFEATRARFDSQVSRVLYVIERIDWAAFFSHIFKLSVEKVAHDIVHGTLLLVRNIERTLTRLIRTLRERLATRTSSGSSPEGFQLKETLRQFSKNFRKK